MNTKSARRDWRRSPLLSHRLTELRLAEDKPVHPLRALLERKGVSLRDGAEILGLSLRTVMAIVNDWHRPRTAGAIAHALGTTAEALFPSPGAP